MAFGGCFRLLSDTFEHASLAILIYMVKLMHREFGIQKGRFQRFLLLVGNTHTTLGLVDGLGTACYTQKRLLGSALT